MPASPETPTTASRTRVASSSTTRTDTRSRRSGRPPTCLYSDGVATPADSATRARVRASEPSRSTSSSASAVTRSGDNPARGDIGTTPLTPLANGLSLAAMTDTRYLDLPDGRLAYEDNGDGPLVVCVPAMADIRAEYRFLTPLLVAAGYRVVAIDLRGMGESSVPWPAYGSEPTGRDLVALLRHLDAGPALIYGCSLGAGAAVHVAAEAPELLRGIVMAGPFVRDAPTTLATRIGGAVLLIPGLTRPLVMGYWPKWEPNAPADL